MECPNCRKAAPEGAEECPSCGIIFAKFRAKPAKAAPPAAAYEPVPLAQSRNPLVAVLNLLIAALTACGGLLLLFLGWRLSSPIPALCFAALGCLALKKSYQLARTVLGSAKSEAPGPWAAKLTPIVLVLICLVGCGYAVTGLLSCGLAMMGGSPERAVPLSEGQGHVEGIFQWLGVPARGLTVVEGCKDAGRDGSHIYLLRPDAAYDLAGLQNRLKDPATMAHINANPNEQWTFSAYPTEPVFRNLGCLHSTPGLNAPGVAVFNRTGSGFVLWRRVIVSVQDRLVFVETGGS